MSELGFVGKKQIFFDTCVITGMARVGKTLLGNVVATSPRVEYVEEPWWGMMMPFAVGAGKLDKAFGSDMFASYLFELFKETYLLRCANFRPHDLSSIHSKKSPEEIEFRKNSVHTFHDVFTRGREQLFVLNVSEVCKDIDFFYSSIPRCKVVYVQRHVASVAEEIVRKGWLSSESLRMPTMAQFYRVYADDDLWHLPWWVCKGEEAYFLGLTDIEKAVYYWCVLTEHATSAVTRCDENFLTVTYEYFTENTEEEYKKISKFLHIPDGIYTKRALADITHTAELPQVGRLSVDLRNRANTLLQKVGYECLL